MTLFLTKLEIIILYHVLANIFKCCFSYQAIGYKSKKLTVYSDFK